MRSFEKKPTKENLLESLQNNSVGQNENLFRFVSLCGQFEDTTSIALDAKWGSGKTFFVRQAKMIIDACNEQSVELTQEEKEIVLSSPKIYGKRLVESTPPMVAVYYDAWENDNDSDPLLSLIYSILQNTMIDYSIRESEGLGDKLSAIVDLVTGRDFSAVVKALKSGDPFSEFKRRDNLRCQINELLESLYQEKGERLIIIVDELDRCKPSFSVHLLERIKHYFIDERITFVFSINASELLHTIEQHYGAGFDATRYLDRFFNFIIPLPSANINQYRALLGWSEEERGLYEISADTFIKHWGPTLRELERYYRAIKTAVDEPDRLRDAIDGISKGNVFACTFGYWLRYDG